MDFYMRKKNIPKVGDKMAMHVFIHQCQDYSSVLGPNCNDDN